MYDWHGHRAVIFVFLKRMMILKSIEVVKLFRGSVVMLVVAGSNNNMVLKLMCLYIVCRQSTEPSWSV